MQAEDQPQYPLLYSVRGFRYCDLLLAPAERAAWQRQLAPSSLEGEGRGEDIDACHAVEQRAAQTIASAERSNGSSTSPSTTSPSAAPPYSGPCWTIPHSALRSPPLTQAAKELTAAVDGLRAAGEQDTSPRPPPPRLAPRHHQQPHRRPRRPGRSLADRRPRRHAPAHGRHPPAPRSPVPRQGGTE